MTLRKIKMKKVLDTSAKMTTRIANKLHLFQRREIVNQTREGRMLLVINFHKKNRKLNKKQENALEGLNKQLIITFN